MAKPSLHCIEEYVANKNEVASKICLKNDSPIGSGRIDSSLEVSEYSLSVLL